MTYDVMKVHKGPRIPFDFGIIGSSLVFAFSTYSTFYHCAGMGEYDPQAPLQVTGFVSSPHNSQAIHKKCSATTLFDICSWYSIKQSTGPPSTVWNHLIHLTHYVGDSPGWFPLKTLWKQLCTALFAYSLILNLNLNYVGRLLLSWIQVVYYK